MSKHLPRGDIRGQHMSHCNQGELVGRCKYGDEADCPAMTNQPSQPETREWRVRDVDGYFILDGPGRRRSVAASSWQVKELMEFASDELNQQLNAARDDKARIEAYEYVAKEMAEEHQRQMRSAQDEYSADIGKLKTQIRELESIATELAKHVRYWAGAGWQSTTRGRESYAVIDRLNALSSPVAQGGEE